MDLMSEFNVVLLMISVDDNICNRICKNPALSANIDFALEAFIVTEVSFQQKRDYCMNGSTRS